MDAPEEFTAVAAEDHLSKTMLAGVRSALSVIAQVHRTSLGKFLLHQQEDVFRNNRFVIALYVILRNGAIVLDPLLCQEVCGIGFLEQGVADVFFVSQDFADCACVPFGFASAGEYTVCFKTGSNLVHAEAFEVFSVNPVDDFCLFRINDQVTIGILGVSEEAVVVDLYLSLLVAVLQAALSNIKKSVSDEK